MQTTIDLPDELFQRAQQAAVERGLTFHQLIEESLAATLAKVIAKKTTASAERRRVAFPIISSSAPGTLVLTKADLARAEDEEDQRRHGFLPGCRQHHQLIPGVPSLFT